MENTAIHVTVLAITFPLYCKNYKQGYPACVPVHVHT